MLDHKILMLLSSFFASVVFFFASSPTHQGPALAAKELALFDSFVRQVCLALDPSDASWKQAQLSLSHGGHGLRLLALHSLAAYIASPSTSDTSSTHLFHALDTCNQSASLNTSTATDVNTTCCLSV